MRHGLHVVVVVTVDFFNAKPWRLREQLLLRFDHPIKPWRLREQQLLRFDHPIKKPPTTHLHFYGGYIDANLTEGARNGTEVGVKISWKSEFRV